MPTQPGDGAGALGDEVFAMIEQQPDFPLDPTLTTIVLETHPFG